MDNGKIPEGEEERAALYRTRLTGRRVLIVLDDARDAAQVRPLLPGSASCAVVVTTRNRAPYLVNTGLVDLGVLPEAEALDLFSRDRRRRPPGRGAAGDRGGSACVCRATARGQDLRRPAGGAAAVADRHDGRPAAGRAVPAG